MNKKIKFSISDFVSVSQTRNYILNDPLIDYLKYYNINNINDKPDKNRKSTISNTLFDEFIMNKGIEYEKKVIDNLEELCKNKYTIYKIENGYYNINNSYYETLNALQENIPIIYQGTLINFENKTYGIADLIMKGYVIKELYNYKNDLIEDELYYIIDIKYSTLHLSTNLDKIKDIDYALFYKIQVYIYTEALNQMVNQNVKIGFLLPKKAEYTKNCKNIIINNTNFNNVYLIDYNNDINYKLLIMNAVIWINKLKTLGSTWKLLPKPSVNELYPNMSNNKDGKWHKLKKELAIKIKEITLITYVGYNERKICFENNIYSYDNPKFNSSLINFNGKKGTIIDGILNINSNKTTDLILPKKINIYNMNNNVMEFYLDYETSNDFEGNNYIFMIGVGYAIDGEWKFKYFLVKDKNSEKEMFIEFWEYINSVLKLYNKKEGLFIHWSSAEETLYNKIREKYDLPIKKFYDLYKLFINIPIFVKNAFSYSLKYIANAMYLNNLIATKWEDNTCNNGLDALIIANNYYDNKKNNITDMKDIINYNEIDCKVLYEILNYIKNI